jgi:parallel beta-helix repeat protein
MSDEIDNKMDRRDFIKYAGLTGITSAAILASMKNAMAETIITDESISLDGKKYANTATVVVGNNGAVDYNTNDYASDDAAIQAAIDYVNVLGGGSVIIREGNYTIESKLTLYDNISLSGIGYSTKLAPKTNLGTNMIANDDGVGGNYNIHIKNIHIYGNSANQVSADYGGIKLDKCKYSTISNIWGDDWKKAAVAISTSSSYCSFYNNMIYDNAALGLTVTGSSKISVTGNHFNSNGEHGANASYGSADIIFANNVAHNNGSSGLGTGYAKRCSFLSNNCTNNTDSGITIVKIDTAPVDMILNDNVCNNNNKNGIELNSCLYATVIGNICKNNSQSGASAYHGIKVIAEFSNDSMHLLISGNICADDQGTPTQGYGIHIWTNAPDDIVLKDNYLINNVDDSISLNASSNDLIIQNNTGFNPTGNFTAPSVPATTVNYTNSYGYPCMVSISGGTVTDIDLDDVSTGLTTGSFVIAPGETINITYSVVPTWVWWGL